MPDQKVLDAAANAELNHFIATTMQLLGASSAYDLKPRDQLGLLTPHAFMPLVSQVPGCGIHGPGQDAVPDAGA